MRLRVTDPGGLTGTDTVTITAGTPPTATIATPTAGTTWRVGRRDRVLGLRRRRQGDPSRSELSWSLVMQPLLGARAHQLPRAPVQTSRASGPFTAPDHEYPAYLELELTATADGLSSTVTRRLDPRTVDLTFETRPAGLAAGGRQRGSRPRRSRAR